MIDIFNQSDRTYPLDLAGGKLDIEIKPVEALFVPKDTELNNFLAFDGEIADAVKNVKDETRKQILNVVEQTRLYVDDDTFLTHYTGIDVLKDTPVITCDLLIYHPHFEIRFDEYFDEHDYRHSVLHTYLTGADTIGPASDIIDLMHSEEKND